MLALTPTLRSGALAAALIAVGAGGVLAADPASPAPVGSIVVSVTPATFSFDCAAFEAASAQTGGVEVVVGGDLVVTLCSNASTGFLWSDPVISDPATLSLTSSTAVPPSSPLPGAAGTQLFGFHAAKAGSASVQLSYSQPWEGGQKDAWTVSLDVTVVPGTAAPVAFILDCAAFEATWAQAGSVEVAVGGDLVVALCSNASTGFVWSDPVISDPGVLSFAGSTAVPPGSPMPGAAGTQRLWFYAEKAGSVSVQLSYSQPWEGGQKDAWTLSLDVTVR